MPCKVYPMKMANDFPLSRRGFLTASLIVSDVLFNRLAGSLDAVAATAGLEPTPVCADADDITPPQTAGPFYKPRSPERKSLLEPGIQGSKIILAGDVRSTKCKPVQGALVDFWQADGSGAYDNAGYRLRGHQFADGAGKYRLETVVPGVYPDARVISTCESRRPIARLSPRNSTFPASRKTKEISSSMPNSSSPSAAQPAPRLPTSTSYWISARA